MPIRHTDKGWFWGSKGPFPSKDKALQVARAAHSQGFKEQNMENTKVADFLSGLLHSVTVTHIYHLQTKSYAQHIALGNFYDEVSDLTDSLIEAIQGKFGIVYGYTLDAGNMSTTALEYMIGLSHFVENGRDDMPQDSEIQNIVDEIAALIDSTIYKLRFLG
jgi:hypothetical protein